MIKLILFVIIYFIIIVPANAQLINEILINPNGGDSNCEYVEIRGLPGENMDDIYFLAIEGDSTSIVGAADRVVDLTGEILGINGLLVITNDAAGDCTRDYNVPETNRVSVTNFSMENGTTSFFLVFSPITLIQGTDYDSDNNGELEFDSSALILDAIAVTDGGANDVMFGNVFFTGAFGAADMGTRAFDKTNRNDQEAWIYGDMLGTNNSLIYDDTQVSPNYTSFFVLTPGMHNPYLINLIFNNGFEN